MFSFSPAKVATCGEGGLAAFRDPAAAERFALLRAYGSDGDYDSRFVGLNGKLSELHAALGCLTVPQVEDEVAAREALVERYRERLGALDGVRLQAVAPEVRGTPTQMVADLGGRRDGVAAALGERGIESRRVLPPAARHGALPRPLLGAAARDRAARRLAARAAAAPAMAAADVDRVCDAVEAVLGAGRPAGAQSFDGKYSQVTRGRWPMRTPARSIRSMRNQSPGSPRSEAMCSRAKKRSPECTIAPCQPNRPSAGGKPPSRVVRPSGSCCSSSP